MRDWETLSVWTCFICEREFDEEDDESFEVDHEYICKSCNDELQRCEHCGTRKLDSDDFLYINDMNFCEEDCHEQYMEEQQ